MIHKVTFLCFCNGIVLLETWLEVLFITIKDINISVVMDVLKEIKDNGDSVVFMRNYLYFHQIMEYAKTIGLIDHNPLNKIKVDYCL